MPTKLIPIHLRKKYNIKKSGAKNISPLHRKVLMKSFRIISWLTSPFSSTSRPEWIGPRCPKPWPVKRAKHHSIKITKNPLRAKVFFGINSNSYAKAPKKIYVNSKGQ